MNRADELAETLLEQGITGMKIWPFDIAAERSDGLYISPRRLKKALEPFEKIRKAVGDRWRSWSSSTRCGTCRPRKKIARALEPYDAVPGTRTRSG